MIQQVPKIANRDKFVLFFTSFMLALFFVIVFNIFNIIFHILSIVNNPNFESIELSCHDGFCTLNGKKIGFSSVQNGIGVLVFWLLLVYQTFRIAHHHPTSTFSK